MYGGRYNLIDPEEIKVARDTMSTQAFRQEFEASFVSFTGGTRTAKHIATVTAPMFKKIS